MLEVWHRQTRTHNWREGCQPLCNSSKQKFEYVAFGQTQDRQEKTWLHIPGVIFHTFKVFTAWFFASWQSKQMKNLIEHLPHRTYVVSTTHQRTIAGQVRIRCRAITISKCRHPYMWLGQCHRHAYCLPIAKTASVSTTKPARILIMFLHGRQYN